MPTISNQKSRSPLAIAERRLTTETVQGAALALESVDNIQRSDGLALGVLSVGDGITDDTLKEGLQNTTGLLVDHCEAQLLATQTRVIDATIATYWQKYA